MSRLDRGPGLCMICQERREDIRNIDLYVIGSEGLNACHKCEMGLVEYVNERRSARGRIQRNNIIRDKANMRPGIRVKDIRERLEGFHDDTRVMFQMEIPSIPCVRYSYFGKDQTAYIGKYHQDTVRFVIEENEPGD